MAQQLIQSTTVTIQMGPFVDATDATTAETGLSPVVEVSKANGTFAARNSATAISHDAAGFYRVELDSTDTNTLGRLIVKSDDAAHRPVVHEFEVVPDQRKHSPRVQFIGFLAADTATSVCVGPFLDLADRTPETALTVANITSGIIKGDPPTNTSITWAASGTSHDMTHIAQGMYSCELTTTDTNSEGIIALTFRDDDVFDGPIVAYAMVVPANVYDSLFGDAGDYLKVDILQWMGTNVAADTAGVPNVNVDEIDGNSTVPNYLENALQSDNTIMADVTKVSTSATAANNIETAYTGGSYNVGGGGIQSDVQKVDGDATAATNLKQMLIGCEVFTVDNTSFTPTATAFETDATEATADHYIGRDVLFVTGALKGASKPVTDYALVGGRGKFTCSTFVGAPANNDVFILV